MKGNRCIPKNISIDFSPLGLSCSILGSIFLAPSSLHGNAGWGVFTTRDISKGEAILQAQVDGPSIPIVDSMPRVSVEPALQRAYEHWNNVFGHYWWGRGVPDHTSYEAFSVADFQITFGALPNHHCLLSALECTLPSDKPYDDTMTNRWTDVGAGAYSYHRGRVFYATRELAAGSELFLSYGYCDRKEMEHPTIMLYPEWTKDAPMIQDYAAAGMAVTQKWHQLLEKYQKMEHIPETDDEVDYDTTNAIDRQSSQNTHADHDLTLFARKLLPSTMKELKRTIQSPAAQSMQVAEDGTMDIAPLMAYLAETFGTTPHTTEYLQDHGLCIEHLRAQPSTLAQAGQGGFAQHKIAEGDIVVPAPLLHLHDKRVLNLTDRYGQQTEWQQLLTNYCFSHSQSSLMMCPTSNAILINHCSHRTKSCGPEGPNAEYRWAGEWDHQRTPHWLNKTVDELADQVERVLALEIVATRDILPGEEVFMDYGPEWEAAWDKHVQEWQPPIDEEPSVHFSIAEANQNDTTPLPYLVSNELREEVDHPYIFTGCFFYPTEADYEDVFQDASGVDFESMSDQDIVMKYADEGSFYKHNLTTYADAMYWPCAVLFQDNDVGSKEDPKEVSYLVRISQHHAHEQLPWDKAQLPRFLYHFPRSSIRYFAKPYHSDAFLHGAFRHPIHIRDEIFPPQWKNLKD